MFFPILFPLGLGTPGVERKHFLRLEDYVERALLLADPSFRLHSQFMFVVFDQLRKIELFKSVKYHVKKNTTLMRRLDEITLAEMQEAAKLKASGKPIPANHRAAPLVNAVNLVAKDMFYSNLVKTNDRNAINSTIIMYGPPTLYITISPRDTHHHLAYIMLNRTRHVDWANPPPELFDPKIRNKQATRDPTALALFFHSLISIIVRKLFGFDNKNGRGIFGNLNAYYGMVESQSRGTLHIHMLLWIKGQPNPDVLFDSLNNDKLFRERVFHYLHQIVCPDGDDLKKGLLFKGAEVTFLILVGLSVMQKIPNPAHTPPTSIESLTPEQLSKSYSKHLHLQTLASTIIIFWGVK